MKARIFIFHCLLLLAVVPACYGGEFQNTLSLQGFTGLLNTPNAEVTDEGKIHILYSDQKESMWRNRTPREESYIFSVGLFSFAEIGGRLTDAPGVARDLSANFKIKAPLMEINHYLPDIAFGMQDVGGGAKHLQTKYLVASEELWRFRFSLGYGTGPDRMDGMFGSAEFKTFDWLYLIGENDAKETNIGARLITPEIFGFPVNMQVMAKTSLDHRPGNMEFGIGLQFPLGMDRRNRTPPPEKADDEEASALETDRAAGLHELSSHAPAATAEKLGGEVDEDAGLRLLQKNLVADGFQNVRVGADADKALLVVEYENSRYNHNELDGLAVVVGAVVDAISPGFEILQLIIRKKGIRVLQLSAPLSDFHEFLHDPEKYGQLNANLEITPDVTVDDEVNFIDGYANPSWLKSELLIYPGLKTFVGTEVGNFDYLLSLKPDYYLNAWKGAVLNARWDIPLDWSKNFEDGRAFRNYRKSSQMDRLMLFQAVKAAPGLMFNLGAGMILHDTYGVINELMWSPGSGNHRFMLKQAYASSDSQAQYQQNKAYLGSYRYYFSPLDLYLEGTAGRFMDNDCGFSLELKRFFGDTAFSVYYKNSRTESKEHVEAGGLQLSIPLTPRRDMKPYVLQVKGANEWSYAQETKIVTPGNANDVGTSIGVTPRAPYNLERVFFNRDRLSEEYIRKHLFLLRINP